MNLIPKNALKIVIVSALGILIGYQGVQAKPINPPNLPDPTDKEISINLKCDVNLPFVGVKVTNNSAYNIPANTPIYWKAYNSSEKFTGKIKGPLAKGASKTGYLIGNQASNSVLKCTADSTFIPK
jgi:hypothetical protein